MAKKQATTPDKTNIRRIKASDDTPKKASNGTETKSKSSTIKTKDKAKSKTAAKPVRDINVGTKNPFVAFGNYIRGAWHELKQVRWPSRSATWKMTFAVLLFSGSFAVLILLLDFAFNKLFELILR